MTKVSDLSTKELRDRLQAIRRLSERRHWAYDINLHLALKEELERRDLRPQRKVA